MRQFSTSKALAISSIAAFLGAVTVLPTFNAVAASPAAIEQATPSVASVISHGTFSGRSDHETVGTARIEKTATGYQLVLGADFELDGAPDPVVALGNNETYVKANKLSKLRSKKGEQTYQLPASFTPGQFAEVYVWCEKFSVPLGVATLTDA